MNSNRISSSWILWVVFVYITPITHQGVILTHGTCHTNHGVACHISNGDGCPTNHGARESDFHSCYNSMHESSNKPGYDSSNCIESSNCFLTSESSNCLLTFGSENELICRLSSGDCSCDMCQLQSKSAIVLCHIKSRSILERAFECRSILEHTFEYNLKNGLD